MLGKQLLGHYYAPDPTMTLPFTQDCTVEVTVKSAFEPFTVSTYPRLVLPGLLFQVSPDSVHEPVTRSTQLRTAVGALYHWW